MTESRNNFHAENSLSPGMSLVALLCIFSSISMSFLRYGLLACIQYSKWGLTIALYRGTIKLFSYWSKWIWLSLDRVLKWFTTFRLLNLKSWSHDVFQPKKNITWPRILVEKPKRRESSQNTIQSESNSFTSIWILDPITLFLLFFVSYLVCVRLVSIQAIVFLLFLFLQQHVQIRDRRDRHQPRRQHHVRHGPSDLGTSHRVNISQRRHPM